eukprot:CAMPEP_0204156312 /NCGR_PEP_ID=MMETSP0361-20130328/30332_1 /ASSEMBLY_ACC=CAM_ASM_000343 /TAXON_ID=268821 /ORGANISM="Scrippsiella Hangoei, Strain SHTV-5" /LENGTH=87 /DNA_ID=CAMNT_0051111925 /DNA_START=59 /DNA_END=322 /DNA_ORIENTATION=-
MFSPSMQAVVCDSLRLPHIDVVGALPDRENIIRAHAQAKQVVCKIPPARQTGSKPFHPGGTCPRHQLLKVTVRQQQPGLGEDIRKER